MADNNLNLGKGSWGQLFFILFFFVIYFVIYFVIIF